VLDKRGWNNEQWRALPADEREELLALFYDRAHGREDMLRRVLSEKDVHAEQITARILIELLREW
jgi:hypothetical protein